jgi:hypothetical protein
MKRSPLTEHQLRAALYVARTVDVTGSNVTAVARAYIQATTDGMHSSGELRESEAILLSAGLLRREAGLLIPDLRLVAVSTLSDEDAGPVLAAALSAYQNSDLETEASTSSGTWDSVDYLERRAEIGEAAEEFVLHLCRTELTALGRPDLADQAQRVSLISDGLGFDVLAPVISGTSRKLEVKGQEKTPHHTARFFISRNEYEVGRRSDDWALVCCATATSPQVLGWCRAAVLAPYLPQDRNGRWTEALVTLPSSALTSGLPDPI